MIKEILHEDSVIIERNLKMYNIVNNTKYTFEDLNISIYDNKVFYYYQLIPDKSIDNIDFDTINKAIHLVDMNLINSKLVEEDNCIFYYKTNQKHSWLSHNPLKKEISILTSEWSPLTSFNITCLGEFLYIIKDRFEKHINESGYKILFTISY